MRNINFQDKNKILEFVIDFLNKQDDTIVLCDLDLAREIRHEFEDYDELKHCSIEMHSDINKYIVFYSNSNAVFTIRPCNKDDYGECNNLILLEEFSDILEKVKAEKEIIVIKNQENENQNITIKPVHIRVNNLDDLFNEFERIAELSLY